MSMKILAYSSHDGSDPDTDSDHNNVSASNRQ